MIHFSGVTNLGNTYSISRVAVVRAFERVQPAPVGIDDHGSALFSALAAFSTLLPSHGRVSFLLQRSRLLGANASEESGDKERSLMHFEWKSERVSELFCVVCLAEMIFYYPESSGQLLI